jgi:hypothetical protein
MMKIDPALLWLNDRLGKRVHVSIAVERGDTDDMVLAASGELKHWSEEKGYAEVAIERPDVAGLYDVGGVELDLTNVWPDAVRLKPDDPSHLIVQLDERTALEIVEQDTEI